jgi:hypothetical protein
MHQMQELWQYKFTRVFVVATLLTMVLGLVGLPMLHSHTPAHAATNSCLLNSPSGTVQHVIYVQFDNVHFTRDNPNVPSDLEQMPHLLNFIKSNGVLLTDHHTPLISHTANDILTSLTGVYGDRHGVPVANSFRYFNPDGTISHPILPSGTALNTGVSFAYWTDPLFDPTTSTPSDTTLNMLTASGKNTPAPWVPFTRAGCNFGSVATANTILENTAVDVAKVYGAGSTQAMEASSNPVLAQADFVGIGVHCALGNSLCSSANTGQPDLLPDEPGGYSGYMGLFGHKYVAPQISPSGPLTDLNGNVIQDPQGNIGFPGFDGMSAAVSLSYVAAMQEHGVPVTYTYISDAHDKHPSGPAYGPGQLGYVQALAAYDDAFNTFFTRLTHDGITQSNTLFVFTADEGDHFVGVTATGCDGVTTPCTYGPNQIGELNTNMAGLLATEQGITTSFSVHSDSAPTVYIAGNPKRTDPVTRTFERATGQLTAVNPYTGNTDTLTKFLADPVEMKILHMVTADPLRTPTFTMFADPNYFLSAGGTSCPTPVPPNTPCVTINPGFAWNHGDVQPEIVTTWLGMVGPGVNQTGIDSATWSDHTDIRPTMMSLLGLTDDYSHDGRVLAEELDSSAQPSAVKMSTSFVALAKLYKQLDACVGQFGLKTLSVSTTALESGSSANDSTYIQLENRLTAFGSQRDTLAAKMIALLEGAEFNNQPFSDTQAQPLIAQGQALLNKVNRL